METTLGKRITANRKRLGLTQDQLAEKLGITAQAVSKWENDLSCPDISILPKLADIFGTTIDTLLGRDVPSQVCETEVVAEETQAEKTFSYDSDSGKMHVHWDGLKLEGIGLACWVLLTGILYLLVQFMDVSVNFWNVLWPSFLFVFGIFGLYPKLSGFRLGCSLFGAYVILYKLQILPFVLPDGILIAVAVVIFGFGLLVDSIRKSKRRNIIYDLKHGNHHHGKVVHEYQIDGTSFSYDSSFGDDTQYIEMDTFHHGSISVNFGDYAVDLRGIANVENESILTADCSFGNLTIIVPQRFAIVPDSSTSFADFQISGQPDANAGQIIHLQASVSFGEICVKYL